MYYTLIAHGHVYSLALVFCSFTYYYADVDGRHSRYRNAGGPVNGMFNRQVLKWPSWLSGDMGRKKGIPVTCDVPSHRSIVEALNAVWASRYGDIVCIVHINRCVCLVSTHVLTTPTS